MNTKILRHLMVFMYLLPGKEPNSIFECISVVILWCAFEVIWITYYMQDRQAVTYKELSLTDIFSKKGKQK